MVFGPEIVSKIVNDAIFDAIDTTVYTDRTEHPWKVHCSAFIFFHPRYCTLVNSFACKLSLDPFVVLRF